VIARFARRTPPHPATITPTVGEARLEIVRDTQLTIQLLREIDSSVERGIRFIWPPAPTVIPPAQLATVSNAIVAALAAARIQLAAIRASEL
jgi:hypothetical protein